MINDNRSDTGYRTITHVVDGKTKECENVCAYIYIYTHTHIHIYIIYIYIYIYIYICII